MPSGYSNTLYEMDEMNPFGLKKHKERVNYAKNTSIIRPEPKLVEMNNSKEGIAKEFYNTLMRSRYKLELDTSSYGFITYKWTVTGATIVSGGKSSDGFVEVSTDSDRDALFTISCTITDQKTTKTVEKNYTHRRHTIPAPIVITGITENIAGSCDSLDSEVCTALSTYTIDAIGSEPLYYQWNIVGGTIVSGQGTESIQVQSISATDVNLNVECVVSNAFELKSFNDSFVQTRTAVTSTLDQSLLYNNTNIATEFIA